MHHAVVEHSKSVLLQVEGETTTVGFSFLLLLSRCDDGAGSTNRKVHIKALNSFSKHCALRTKQLILHNQLFENILCDASLSNIVSINYSVCVRKSTKLRHRTEGAAIGDGFNTWQVISR